MKIGINALYLLPGKVGGSETYIRNLVTWLAEIDAENRYYLFVNRESAGIFESLAPRVRVIHCPVNAANRPARILWEQLALPVQVRRRNLDVLLSAGMTAPFRCPCPSLLVIFDLQHVNQPQNFTRFQLFFLRTIIRLSARFADRILTISEHVKRDIVKHYGIEPRDIAVAHLAVNHGLFRPEGDDDGTAVRKKYNLPEHYLLYSAALLQHKNHRRLLEAFREIKGAMPGWKLVLTGAWETGHDAIAGAISALGLQDDVVMLGWLPFEDIPEIYRGAELFVYPSLHEGFGLPVLEAMASGVPVLCSRMEPLIEVAGDAALLVDPYDSADIGRGILSVYRDETLRQKLIDAGLKRAGTFTWERTARKTLEVLNSMK